VSLAVLCTCTDAILLPSDVMCSCACAVTVSPVRLLSHVPDIAAGK
jgi:hypothetical protein